MAWLRNGFAILVVGAWCLGFIVDLVNPSYQPPAELTPLVLGVATYLLGAPAIREWRHRDRES